MSRIQPIEAWPRSTVARVDGRELLAFSGCDYLGLSHHEDVLGAIEDGLRRYGSGANASRVTTGSTDAHERLEAQLATMLKVEAALITPDGTLANLVACEGLAQDYRDAFVDEQAHASLATAARAACIRVVTYPHGSVPELPQTGGMAVMTDGVFGARGTLAPIGPLVEALAPRARLLVDDCHGVGVLGPRGCGSLSAAGVDDPRVVVTASLAKAIGVAGGVVAADHSFVERLRQSSATFRGSTPIPPAIAMGASVALSILENEPRLVSSLRRNVERVHSLLLELQVDPGARDVPVFTIVPASAQHAARLDSAFKRSGLLIPLIDYPGGPARSYFRIAVSAAHTEQDLDRLEQTLRQSLAVVESDDGATGER